MSGDPSDRDRDGPGDRDHNGPGDRDRDGPGDRGPGDRDDAVDSNHWSGRDDDDGFGEDTGRDAGRDGGEYEFSDEQRGQAERGRGRHGDRAPWETGVGSDSPFWATAEVIGAVLLAFVAAVALVIVGTLAVLFTSQGEPGTVETLLVSLVGSQVGFVLGSLAYLRWRGESVRDIGLEVPGVKQLGIVVLGLVAIFGLMIGVLTVVSMLGLEGAQNQTATTAQEVPSSLLLLIPIAIFVIGPAEELLFRGVVQRRLRQVASAPVAIVGASALFAVAHVIALVGDPSAMAITVSILFVPALVFGVLYEYTQNVVVTALVHGLYDAVIFGLLYVVVKYGPESAEPAQSAIEVGLGLL